HLMSVSRQILQLLLSEQQRVPADGDQVHRVAVLPLFGGKPKLGFDGLRPLRAEMKLRLSSADRADLDLKPPPHHLVHQLEKADEVRLPGSVRPDEDVERTEF